MLETKEAQLIYNCLKKEPTTHVWIVGGAVRDSILARDIQDVDLATNLIPEKIKEALEYDGISVHQYENTSKHGVVKATLYLSLGAVSSLVDIATLRKDTNCDGRYAVSEYTDEIEEDLARRDFTINAMAVELPIHYESDIIDPFGGIQDAKNKIVRFVGSPEDRVKEDYLRMIRACRFTALGPEWCMTEDAAAAIRLHAKSIHSVSKERIRDEIIKGLNLPAPANMFRSMAASGLLKEIFPEMADGIGCGQNQYHAEEVFDHLCFALDEMAGLTDLWDRRLAAVLHDVGKPATKSTDSKGNVHFYKHEIVGASIAYNWMKKYKFSKRSVDYIVKMIRHHQFRFEADSKDKIIKRWLREVGIDWEDLFLLRQADRGGNLAKRNRPRITKQMILLTNKIEEILHSDEPVFDQDLAMNGDLLIRMEYKPGPVFKEILQDCWSLVLNEPEKNNYKELMTFVRKNWNTDGTRRTK